MLKNEKTPLIRLGLQPNRRSVCLQLSLAPLMALAWPAVGKTSGNAYVTEISDGIFAHHGRVELQTEANRGDISNNGFIVGHEAVAVVDTGGSYQTGLALREAVKQATNKPIKYVINTHMHPDHVLGDAAFLPDNPQFVGHAKLARALGARSARYLEAAREAMGEAAFAGTEIVMPTLEVSEPTELDLGNRKIVLEPQPTAHTDNDLVVRDRKTGTAFLGDLIFSVHVPALDGSIVGWMDVLEKFGTEAPAVVVPGHGPVAMQWPEASQPIQRYLGKLASDVREIIKRGGTIKEAIETAGESERGKWKLFDEFHRRNVTAAFAELEWE